LFFHDLIVLINSEYIGGNIITPTPTPLDDFNCFSNSFLNCPGVIRGRDGNCLPYMGLGPGPRAAWAAWAAWAGPRSGPRPVPRPGPADLGPGSGLRPMEGGQSFHPHLYPLAVQKHVQITVQFIKAG
jgi:hypothetical protein